MDKQISDNNNTSSNLINNKRDIFPQKKRYKKTESVALFLKPETKKENESYITMIFYFKSNRFLYERIDILRYQK